MIDDPHISVVMPVYNSEKFLKKAIDSILNQTYAQFELILVNDCSTDNSEKIIYSYSDPRIVYYKLEQNMGVVEASNFGLQHALALYTCIMHSDDIAAPARLAEQKKWLDDHKKTAAISSFITFINEEDAITGEWIEDRKNISAKEIKQTMPWVNCIAHPTVMIRTNIYKKYKYHINQQAQEDYDLWMRMLSDGLIIEKIPTSLLYYRVHSASITSTILRKANPFFKQFNCKKKFLHYQLANNKWGWFESKVVLTAIYDGIMGIGKNIKRSIIK
jgi:glycosyltransferase involved in cell wall biosynthesis